MLIAAVPLAVGGVLIEDQLQGATDPEQGRGLLTYLFFGLSLAGAGSTYLIAAYLLRIPEFFQVLGTVQRRFNPQRQSR